MSTYWLLALLVAIFVASNGPEAKWPGADLLFRLDELLSLGSAMGSLGSLKQRVGFLQVQSKRTSMCFSEHIGAEKQIHVVPRGGCCQELPRCVGEARARRAAER